MTTARLLSNPAPQDIEVLFLETLDYLSKLSPHTYSWDVRLPVEKSGFSLNYQL